MNRERVRIALGTSRDLNEVYMSLSESEILEALDIESKTLRRRTHIERLATRLAAIRAETIRNEIMQEYTPWRTNLPPS